jgi:hypothetical protein
MVAVIMHLRWPGWPDVEKFFADLTWTDVKQAFDVGNELFTRLVYFLIALAVIVAVLRIRKIIEALGEFRRSRGPILDLYDRIDDLKSNVLPTIDQKVQALQTQIKEQIDEKLQALADQVKAGQQYAGDNLIEPETVDSADSPPNNDWELIRSIWTDARNKLEKIIEEADGRRTRKYARLPRQNYKDVITALLNDGFINNSIADDAYFLNRQFRSLRNGKRVITDEIKNEFARRKKHFDEGIARLKSPVRTQTATTNQELLNQVPDRSPAQKPNGGTVPARPVG